jgi:hypothetical protein
VRLCPQGLSFRKVLGTQLLESLDRLQARNSIRAVQAAILLCEERPEGRGCIFLGWKSLRISLIAR